MLNYQSIVKQIPFFLFMTALAVVYIYNGHVADKMMRKTIKSGRELKDLQNEYKSVKGEALLHSRQSEVTDAAAALGLTKSSGPVVLLDSTAQTN